MTTMLAVARVDRELHVRAAGLDADAADARERGVAHALVLDVGERLRGRDGDRVAGVHAHRVEVLDRADDDHVVGVVAHHLELVLLPPDDARSMRISETGLAARPRSATRRISSAVVRDAGAAAAEDERGPHDQRVADLVGDRAALRRPCTRCPTAAPRRPISVIAALNRCRSSAVWIASTLAPISSTPNASSTPASCELDREVEPGLAAERREQRVGPLLLDDARRASATSSGST